MLQFYNMRFCSLLYCENVTILATKSILCDKINRADKKFSLKITFN